MNKILKVDVDGAYALVEPGVTFFDLRKLYFLHVDISEEPDDFQTSISSTTTLGTGFGSIVPTLEVVVFLETRLSEALGRDSSIEIVLQD